VSGRAAGPRRLIAFAAMAVLSLVFAFLLCIPLVLGECVPRDGSAAMHACDAAKRFEFRAFPILLLVAMAAAFYAVLKLPRLSPAIVLAAPFVALAVVIAVERTFY
jgi:hypothetical protein